MPEYIEPMFGSSLQRWMRAVPSTCAICRSWPSRLVCDACVERFAQPIARCRKCALPVVAGVQHCGACLLAANTLDTCHAAVTYGYPWSDCISAYKFAGQTGWANFFAGLLQAAPWVESALEGVDLVLPLPLSHQRLAQRGFNQAWLLARKLAPQKARADCLLRLRDTRPQSELKRAQRLHNVQDAFVIEPAHYARLRGKRVALIDDVMTSGASLLSAAQTLRRAGVEHVCGIVVARTDAPG